MSIHFDRIRAQKMRNKRSKHIFRTISKAQANLQTMQSFQTIGINVLQELSTQGIHYLYTSIDSSSGARTLTKLKMGKKTEKIFSELYPNAGL